MAKSSALLDRWGQPLQRADLTRDVAAPTLTGVRSPLTGYPADGLDPYRLAQILREADQGDPVRYLELAETIEERDPHYLGVLGTRRRSVSQIDITVTAASEDAQDEKIAAMVRDWLDRDELQEELFDILDCIGKGYSLTEIIWDASEGQWQPKRLEWRDPRWFRFRREDLATPVLIGEGGEELPLPAFKFIYSTIKAKSGLALRSGLARAAAWGWMFKAFTQRDWAIFTQTYGQPLRVGKWGPGASETDKETLFRAVANIAGDCAAIIPESMQIEFIETRSVGATAELYKQRADWLDQQISKAVLGQTATTDAIAGGHAVGQEHRQVQEDIERADCRALSAILNRDLIRPWVDLEYGPQQRYPRLKIERPEQEDLTALAAALGQLVPLGLDVPVSHVRKKFGVPERMDGEAILTPPAPASGLSGAENDPDADPEDRTSNIERDPGFFKRGAGSGRGKTALNAEGPPAALPRDPDAISELTTRMAIDAAPAVATMVGQIEAMLDAAGSLEEFREMLLAGFPKLDSTALAQVLAQGMMVADVAGRVEAAEGD